MIRLIILLIIYNLVNASNYTYLLDEYSDEIKQEAVIVTKMARDMLSDKAIKLYIPKATKLEHEIYSQMVVVVDSCEEANFIFVKHNERPSCRGVDEKIILTNNYKHLSNDSACIGAFYWSKSRPNIVLLDDRLKSKNIKLSNGYDKYIEK